MTSNQNFHVFVSYMREDQALVNRITAEFQTHGISVWHDREKIQPGERWQIAIRRAIEEGAFFIACFSAAHRQRDSSYMNVELAVAIEELRRRPTDRIWFIPVVFSASTVPDRSIGGGETLRDIQWVDLSEDWDAGLQRIVGVIRPVAPLERPRGLEANRESAAVLVADLVGYTSLLMHLGDGAVAELIQHLNEAWTPELSRHDARDISRVGDGMVATFKHPNLALACGRVVLHTLTEQAPRDHGNQLQLRVGIDYGSLVTKDGMFFGAVVNCAVRICSAADPGQILLSDATKREIDDTSVRFRLLGEVALKGFSKSLRLWAAEER